MNPRSKTTFDDGWQIHVGDDLAQPRRIIAKAGTANGWTDFTKEENEKFDSGLTDVEAMGEMFQVIQLRPSDSDAKWKPVSLPHDWRVEMTPDENFKAPVGYPFAWQGFFPTGVAYYRKIFEHPYPAPGDHVTLILDGIAGFTDVWMNGFWIGQQSSHYSPLSIEITEFLRPESPNVILVRSDSNEAEGWWFEGGGIYRHTWLETYTDLYIPQDGIYVSTPEVSSEQARVQVEVEVRNEAETSDIADLEVVVRDPDGQLLSLDLVSTRLSVSAGSIEVAKLEFMIQTPQLWQVGQGRLYTLTLRLKRLNQLEASDIVTQNFGVRNIQCVDDSILVNGIKTKVLGVNLHQDFGFFGNALPDRIVEAKLDLCKEMGVNVVRTAHHAPAPELVAHADRIGMLLVVENRQFSTSVAVISHLQSLIRNYRSNPSVFLWSLENEEMNLEGSRQGSRILKRLIKEIRYLDHSRMITVGGVMKLENEEYYGQLDILGLHYRCFFGDLEGSTKYIPSKPRIMDEEGIFATTRGVYQYDRTTSYPGAMCRILEVLADRAVPETSGAIGIMVKICDDFAENVTAAFSHPKYVGVCLWTGIDYFGEPSPARWPVINSGYGMRDIVGFPKDVYWFVRCVFKPDQPLVHAFPHWTWPGKEGQIVPFRVYSNCDTVEILVNGKVIGEPLPVVNHKVELNDGVCYEPGNIKVRGIRDGTVRAEHVQNTAGPAKSIYLMPDRMVLGVSGNDIAVVRIAIVDHEGTLSPDSDARVRCSFTGPGKVAGLYNGDPVINKYTHAVEEISVFHGLAVVFVQAGNEEGKIQLTVSGEGLTSTSLELDVSGSVNEHGPHPLVDEAKVSIYGLHNSLG